MITEKDFIEEINRPFSKDFLAAQAIELLESGIQSTFDDLISSSEQVKNDTIERIKNNGIARVFIWNEYAYKCCKELFEERGFKVDYYPATGITVYLKSDIRKNK
jgi:hypothetical protein